VVDVWHGGIRYTRRLWVNESKEARSRDAPMTELNSDGVGGTGGGDGVGAVLHGLLKWKSINRISQTIKTTNSSPSSYTEFASGFSSTKLPPNVFVDPEP
jgi:hypothetical protein